MNELRSTSAKAQELLTIARHFIRCNIASRDGLKQLGILRSERTLQGDYAEWLVAQLLNLKLAESTVEKAIDATDHAGQKYQIKSRLVRTLSQSTSFDFREIETRFDYLVAVLLSPSLEVLAVLRVPHDVVVELGSQTVTTFRFRWNSAVSQDPRIERLIWNE